MVKCPKCGEEVAAPVKTWPLPSRRTNDQTEHSRLIVGIYECTSCRARFRAATNIEAKTEDTANIKNMVERIKGIQGELMQTLRNLREKIKTLETERSNLMTEIDKLRDIAESRISALQSEVNMLREDAKSLRELLGYNEETEKNSIDS